MAVFQVSYTHTHAFERHSAFPHLTASGEYPRPLTSMKNQAATSTFSTVY